MRISIIIETPRVPNFIRLADKKGSIDIAELTTEQIKEIGKEWTKSLQKESDKRKSHK